ncbi:hypothetical protein BJV78DRAFT_1197918 [Lactifluus subvellereus]|nr:hypothetical protein BJV78DRAFT_1197918 [Lactifluus subvellereus]
MSVDSPNHPCDSCNPRVSAGLWILFSTWTDVLTLRALVSTKDADVITGKDGEGVANLHEQTGVKADVSENLPDVHERVISISGSVESVAEAYALIVAWLVKASPSTRTTSAAAHTSLRLLVSHKLMGTVIGRNGLKIKAIQDSSGARMVASKQMLPESTERLVDVQGPPEAIGRAIEEIGRCLLQDWERGFDTVLYHPAMTDEHSGGRSSPGKRGKGKRDRGKRSNGRHGNGRRANGESNTHASAPTNPCQRRTTWPIFALETSPYHLIWRLSGSKISIAKTPHDETDERMFTISEKQRREEDKPENFLESLSRLLSPR